MKKIIYLFIVFNTSLVNLYANGIPLSSNSDTNTYNWIKGRNIISVNLSPGYAGLFPPLINTVFNNYKTFTGLLGINLGTIEKLETDKYIDAVDAKGMFWYVPNISYTLLVHPRVGIEVALGVQSMSFNLTMPKDKAAEIIDALGINIGNNGSVSGNIIASDTALRTSMLFIPVTLGIKFYGGKNRQVVNTFRFGIEALISNVETENGITGVKTKRNTIDTGLYISYELGWSIELFPSKEWRVKPYIDISLFEIGYYVRSGLPGVYGDVVEGISFFGSGIIDIGKTIPSWNSFPSWVNYVSAIRFSIFPRIGFSIRF